MEGDGPGGDRPDLATERAMEAVEAVPCPTVAFVNGAAFGAGCELAVTCDLRIASQGAKLGMPPAKLGVVYAAAGVRRFLALVGPAHTREMFFTGRPVDAAKALAIGLVDRVASPADAEAAALALADEIAGNAPLAVQGMKRILRLLGRPTSAASPRRSGSRSRPCARAPSRAPTCARGAPPGPSDGRPGFAGSEPGARTARARRAGQSVRTKRFPSFSGSTTNWSTSWPGRVRSMRWRSSTRTSVMAKGVRPSSFPSTRTSAPEARSPP